MNIPIKINIKKLPVLYSIIPELFNSRVSPRDFNYRRVMSTKVLHTGIISTLTTKLYHYNHFESLLLINRRWFYNC